MNPREPAGMPLAPAAGAAATGAAPGATGAPGGVPPGSATPDARLGYADNALRRSSLYSDSILSTSRMLRDPLAIFFISKMSAGNPVTMPLGNGGNCPIRSDAKKDRS